MLKGDEETLPAASRTETNVGAEGLPGDGDAFFLLGVRYDLMLSTKLDRERLGVTVGARWVAGKPKVVGSTSSMTFISSSR